MERRNFLRLMAALLFIPKMPIELPQIFVDDIFSLACINITVTYKNKHACKFVPNWKIRNYPNTISLVLCDLIYKVYRDQPSVVVSFYNSKWYLCLETNKIGVKRIIEDCTKINKTLKELSYEMQMR